MASHDVAIRTARLTVIWHQVDGEPWVTDAPTHIRVLFNDDRTYDEVKRDEQRNVEAAIALGIDPDTI